MQKPLLIEIGVEELPAIPLLKILKQIKSNWEKILKANSLSSDFEFLYTPRRLVLIHKSIALKQDDNIIEFFGMPLSVAIKDDKPTKAGEGFARKCGVSFDKLTTNIKNGKEVLYFRKEVTGKKTADLLEDMILEWISSMSFGKMMRWGDRSDDFIRPIRWLQVRLGDEIVDASLYGQKSSNLTFVHRMVDFNAKVVDSIDSYLDILEDNMVMLNQNHRKQKILFDFDIIEKENNLIIERDSSLLDEIVAITENPKALLGSFDEKFLELPPEVIITSMKEHQRYFAVFKDGNLTNKFIVVSNAVTDDYSKVIEGNERVLKPRLADGMFFYENDLRDKLSTDGLENIQFMDGLGSLKDKIEREANIAIKLLDLYNSQLKQQTGKSKLELEKLILKAVHLAKADLTSEMVYEFTELQGLMGYYYAKAEGEDELVVDAIKEQYMPLGEGGELPSGIFSSIIAISIKLDTLVGLFSVGKIPTGSKDPFALRRAVNGITRIVYNYDLTFNIDDILTLVKDSYSSFDEQILKDFMIERVKKSITVNPSLIQAVLSSGEMDINEILKKVEALDTIVSSSEFTEQFSTFKRVANISKDIDLNGELSIDTTLFNQDEEIELYNNFIKISSKDYDDYTDNLNALFSLKDDLDKYFDEVMVNVEDKAVKNNRLNMIASIYKSFKEIADIKEISI